MRCNLAKLLKKSHRRYNSTIAIDFGPSTSVVCVLEDGVPKVIENIEGERTTPAFVSFEDDRVVGITARRQALVNPKSTVYGWHGLIGQKYNQELLSKLGLNYKLAQGKEGAVAYENAKGKLISMEEVTSVLLQRMKETAENNLGKQVTNAVIGVPSYYKEAELNSLKEAAQMIGLTIDNFVPEPIAAALAYGLGKQTGSKKIIVFDLGGRSLDITLLDFLGGSMQIKYTARDEFLGGETFDNLFIEYIKKEFLDKEGIDLTGNKLAMQKLKNAAEVAKCELSTSMSNEINIPYIAADEKGPKHLLVKVSRSKLESLLEPLINKTLEPIQSLLTEAGLQPKDIDEILLVGGQAKTPRIAEALETFFGKPTLKNNALSPDEAVAMGLHLYSGAKLGSDVVTKFTKVPLNIGVDVFGHMETLIPLNTSFPVEVKRIFTTANDNQSDVDIKILMGASKVSAKNEPLLRVSLSQLPSSLRRELQIEVTLSIDEEGDLTVTAQELTTKMEPLTAEIKSFGGLSQERANVIIEEAKKFDEVTGLKELEERKQVFMEFSEIERTIYSFRTMLGDIERNKLIKQLTAYKIELENGTLAEPRQKYIDFQETMSQTIHNAVKEEQKKLLNYE
jgi:molecular chaperone DnaK